MKLRTPGLIVIAIGILMLAYTGFNYVTTERVVDIGPIKIDQEKNHPVQWSPVIGIALLIGGGLMMFSGKKASS